MRDHGSIARRGRGEDGVGAEAGDRACDVHQILDADGDAVQGAAIAAGRELFLGRCRLGTGGFSKSAHDGVELAVVAVDPLEAGFHDRRRRQRATPVVPTERGDGAEGDAGVGVSQSRPACPHGGPAAALSVIGSARSRRSASAKRVAYGDERRSSLRIELETRRTREGLNVLSGCLSGAGLADHG